MSVFADADLRMTYFAAEVGVVASVLIVASEPAASEVAKHLREGLRAEVETVGGLAQCRKILRHKSFTLVLLEESIAATSPEAVDALYDALDEAWIIEVNFGLAGAERILRQVTAMLARKARNAEHTREAVLRSVRNQLTSCLTGLLLESQLALRGTDGNVGPALHRIVGLAERLSELVQTVDDHIL